MLEAGETYWGGCLCGQIRYEVIGPSLFEAQCCCRDCQKATGTGHTTIVGLHNSQLALTGTPKQFETIGESGGSVVRHFCPNCGGRVYTTGTAPGEVVMIQAGSLDTPGAVTPTEVIYHDDAIEWDCFAPHIAIYGKYGPMSDETRKAIEGQYAGPRLSPRAG